MAAHERNTETETGSASSAANSSAPGAENAASTTGNAVNSDTGTAGNSTGTGSPASGAGTAGTASAASMPSASDDQPTRVHTKSTAQRALELRSPILNLLAGIVRWVGVLFAVVLVLHVILVIGEANPGNGITQFVANFADTVSIGFKKLFTPDDAKLQVLVNYGIAAIFWLVVSAIVGRLLKRLA